MIDDSSDSIDVLLSADLDGETTPTEHERIENDPELRSRRDRLRGASELASQPPAPLSSATVDASIEGALSEQHPLAPPRQVAARRSRPRRTAGPAPWLVAAVVILLAGIGIGLVVTARPSSQRQKATSSAPTTVPGGHGKSADAELAPSASGGSPLPYIGDFATPAALRTRLAARIPAGQQSAATSRAPGLLTGQADRCSTVVEARDPRLVRSNRRAVVAASLAGQPVVVLEYAAKAVDSQRQTTRVMVVGSAACDERVDFQR